MNIGETLFQLRQKHENFPLRKPSQEVLLALWTKHPIKTGDCHIITPDILCQTLQ